MGEEGRKDGESDVAQPPPAVQDVRLTPAKDHYRRNLPHFQPAEKTLFVTFRTWKGFVIPESLRGAVLKHCLHDHRVKAWFYGVVIMPDHVHLVFAPLPKTDGDMQHTLAEILGGIKGASAHSINRALNRRGHVWQDESYDHALRSPRAAVPHLINQALPSNEKPGQPLGSRGARRAHQRQRLRRLWYGP